MQQPGAFEHPRTVVVEIRVPAGGPDVDAASVVVDVIDDSRADAPSPVIGREIVTGARLSPVEPVVVGVPVAPDLVDERNRYTVMVHADVAGSGQIEVGDWLTVQSYPVLTRGHPAHAVVELRPVT